ncbi:MAG: response regulator [Magnetococcales bacterium]|nr:response regulator [Magnetococcales bacterium]NGZ25886.1 response regulator [Magnetococcales bacterium]
MGKALENPKILIIDDEMEIQKSVGRFLAFLPEFQDVEILFASSFEEGLNVVEAKNPLIILQDINLPDGNGLQFVRQVKKAHPVIQFIIITGASNLDRVIDAMSYGAVDYLKKPMDLEMLKVVIQESLNRCHRWGSLFAEEYRLEESGNTYLDVDRA